MEKMGWSIGYDEQWKRDIGYGVPAWCDHPDCDEVIDRGLAYVCGGEPFGGDAGCGLYFCEIHKGFYDPSVERLVCERCRTRDKPFEAKPDHPDWINHKATDPSWAAWRAEQEQPQ